jgi:DNA-binding response OmpR family regulator
MTYRILIVDDQKEVSRLLRSALETIEQGLEVVEAPSGEEAILEATRKKIDLLVADFRLPGITGVQLMKKISARNPGVKVIMVTGVTDPRLVREVSECGADAYFLKPVPIGDFLDAVERTLGLARTILHTPLPSTPPPQEPGRPTLADLLVNLRKDMAAQAVLLLNGQGHVEAEAGDLPDPNNAVSLISALMGMYNAAQKVASILDHAENHLHLFNSDKLDGVFLPIGVTHGLLVLGIGLSDLGNLPKNLERLSVARADILEMLSKTGVVHKTPEPAAVEPKPVEEREEVVEIPNGFDDLFSHLDQKSVDASAFWDSAIEQGTTFSQPDKLTYEQAERLGLTPGAEKKE